MILVSRISRRKTWSFQIQIPDTTLRILAANCQDALLTTNRIAIPRRGADDARIKTAVALVTASILAAVPTVANEEKKAAAGADAAWAEIEPMFAGPKERPKSREEAVEIYKKYLAA